MRILTNVDYRWCHVGAIIASMTISAAVILILWHPAVIWHLVGK